MTADGTRNATATEHSNQHPVLASSSSRSMHTTTRLLLQQQHDHGHLPSSPTSQHVHRLQDAFSRYARVSLPPNYHPSPNTMPASTHSLHAHAQAQAFPPGRRIRAESPEARKMYSTMLFLPAFDLILSKAQLQGRISFIMTSAGEEAAIIGEYSRARSQRRGPSPVPRERRAHLARVFLPSDDGADLRNRIRRLGRPSVQCQATCLSHHLLTPRDPRPRGRGVVRSRGTALSSSRNALLASTF
ncbi:hypothetical protein V8E36_002603 [Tilletia maclaganii]